MRDESLNIYQMYVKNICKLGFFVQRDSWRKDRYAKVIAIEGVEDGKMIPGKPPYFGGFLNPPGHPRAGKIMGPRLVTLKVKWFEGGINVRETGGNSNNHYFRLKELLLNLRSSRQ
jgi:hypothetical protein